MSKRRKITFEIEQHLIVRRKAGKRIRLFCSFCGKDAETLTIDEAAAITSGGQAISNWIQLGRLHTISVEAGLPVICCNSLEKALHHISEILE